MLYTVQLLSLLLLFFVVVVVVVVEISQCNMKLLIPFHLGNDVIWLQFFYWAIVEGILFILKKLF